MDSRLGADLHGRPTITSSQRARVVAAQAHFGVLAGGTFHGDAFQREWAVVESRLDSAVLELADGAFGPYHYQAQVRYRLSESEFETRLTLTNLGAVALPFGAGFHPWFPRSPQTKIRFGATGYWPENVQHLPATSQAQPLLPETDYTDARSLPQGWINVGFSGWNGLASIDQGPQAISVQVRSDEAYTTILYSPSDNANFFCFEPVSHPVNAHNMPSRPGLVTLATSEQLHIGMTLAWS